MQRFNQLWRVLLGVLLIALMVEIVIVAPSHLGTPEDLAISRSQKDLADRHSNTEKAELVIDGAHYLEWEVEGDAKEWELWAKTASRMKNEKVYRIEGVKIQFMKNNGVTYNVTGDHGEVHEDTKDLLVRGHVVTRSANGYKFETEVVNYNSEKKTLVSPTDIRMIGPVDQQGSQLRLTGRTMDANLNTNVIVIGSRVRANKVLADSRNLTITSRRAVLSGATHMAEFQGDVVMDVDSVHVTGPEAQFNYRPGSNATIESVLVRGGARLSDVDKWATANQVLYEVDQDRYTFEGAPRVVQNNDQLVGDKIVFYDGGKQIEVLNAKAKVNKSRMEQPSP